MEEGSEADRAVLDTVDVVAAAAAAAAAAGVIVARFELRERGGCTATAATVRDVITRGTVAAPPTTQPSLPSLKVAAAVGCGARGVGEASADCDCDREPPWLAYGPVPLDVVVVVLIVVALCGVGRRDGCGSATGGVDVAAVFVASWRARTFF